MHDLLLAKRAADIRGLFGRIAHRYDLLNRLLSLGQDLRWRRAVTQRVASVSPKRVLDVCTGTGDLALGVTAGPVVFGCDFCLPMLVLARRKGATGSHRPSLFAADALHLPIADGSVDLTTVAFGVRNFEDLEAGLGELARVLRPGGILLVLEFSRARGPLAPLLEWWVGHIPPLVGRLVSGDREAYGYLTASVREFPDGAELAAVIEGVGLDDVKALPQTGGVATLYEAVKPAVASGQQEEDS